MSTENEEQYSPADPKRHPTMLKIMLWLAEDSARILPLPDDDDGIKELAQAIGKEPEHVRKLMTWNYGDDPDEDTLRILT